MPEETIKRDNWALSSKGDGSISTTVKGLLTLSAPMIIVTASYFGLDIGQSDFAEFVENITAIIAALTGAAGVIITAYGAIRRLINMWFKRGKYAEQ